MPIKSESNLCRLQRINALYDDISTGSKENFDFYNDNKDSVCHLISIMKKSFMLSHPPNAHKAFTVVPLTRGMLRMSLQSKMIWEKLGNKEVV